MDHKQLSTDFFKSAFEHQMERALYQISIIIIIIIIIISIFIFIIIIIFILREGLH